MDLAALAAVLVALGGVLKLTLDALRDQRRGFEKFLGNHMSKNTAALEHVAQSVELLRREIEEGRAVRERHREPNYRRK